MKKLQTITVGAGGQSTLDFTSISQVYTDLLIEVSMRDNISGVSNDAVLNINGSAITFKQMYGTGVNVGSNTPAQIARPVVGGTATANTFGNTQIYITNYSNTTLVKPIVVDSVCETNGSESYQVLGVGTYASATAVTSIQIAHGAYTFAQGTIATLYGINPIPTASLGAPTAVDALVVAGGGSGAGAYYAGGGGAGGYQVFTAATVASGSAITVTVGAGGASVSGAAVTGNAGSNSQFGALTASVGGGLGQKYSTSSPGGTGGSGGGGGGDGGPNGSGGYNFSGGAGTAGQGYAGGTAYQQSSGLGAGGGGGGAGAVGSNAAQGVGGNGGAGAISTINGFSQYYAGGGGGAAYLGAAAGTGGSGVGGNGGLNANGSPGAINTGSGGGAGGGASTSSGAGGSGIVIIRYPQTYTAPTATTGNPAVNYINGYRVYTWYNSGSITF